MIIILFFAVLAIISSILYGKKEKTVFKTFKRVSFGALSVCLFWIASWGTFFKYTNPDSRVIEAVKEFEWADKEKLTSLGIEYKSYESNDGSFGIHIADTQEDEYFYVYIYGGSNDTGQSRDSEWIVDGDFAYSINAEIYLNNFLIPEQKDYNYRFETKDVQIYVFGKCKMSSKNNFDNFVLEKLK